MPLYTVIKIIQISENVRWWVWIWKKKIWLYILYIREVQVSKSVQKPCRLQKKLICQIHLNLHHEFYYVNSFFKLQFAILLHPKSLFYRLFCDYIIFLTILMAQVYVCKKSDKPTENVCNVVYILQIYEGGGSSVQCCLLILKSYTKVG